MALHTATGGRTPIVAGTDHRGNIGVGPSHNSVAYQQKQQRKMQDKHTQQVQESFSSNPISLIRRTNPSHVYWKELEAMPQKVKLAREIRDLFQPLSSYIPQNHKGRAHPLTQIHNAYHMPIDTSEYLVNRAYYSKLYKSMRGADISHQDILAIWGNPYIGVAIGWDKVPHTR